jgi:hypothetical protein
MCCKILVKNGADPYCYNYRGWRALDYFNENYTECMDIITTINKKEDEMALDFLVKNPKENLKIEERLKFFNFKY